MIIGMILEFVPVGEHAQPQGPIYIVTYGLKTWVQ